MALVSVTEIQSQRSGHLDPSNQRQYTRVFCVVFDNPGHGQLEALVSEGVPEAGDTYEDVETALPDEQATMRQKTAEQQDSCVWFVTCEYDSTLEAEEQNGAISGDSEEGEPGGLAGSSRIVPDERPWSLTTSTETIEEVAEKEWSTPTALTYLNSAGMAFDPPVMVSRSLPVINISISRSSWSFAKKIAYENKINDDSFTILGQTFPAKSLLVKSYNAKTAKDNMGYYWVVDLSLVYNERTWTKRILDAGMWESYEDAGEVFWTRITDTLGQPIEKPVPLSDGQRAGPNLTVHLLREVYEKKDFDSIV